MDATTTHANLIRLNELATAAPWSLESTWSSDGEIDTVCSPTGTVVHPQDEQGGPSWNDSDDAELIVVMRNALPRILDLLRDLQTTSSTNYRLFYGDERKAVLARGDFAEDLLTRHGLDIDQ